MGGWAVGFRWVVVVGDVCIFLYLFCDFGFCDGYPGGELSANYPSNLNEVITPNCKVHIHSFTPYQIIQIHSLFIRTKLFKYIYSFTLSLLY